MVPNSFLVQFGLEVEKLKEKIIFKWNEWLTATKRIQRHLQSNSRILKKKQQQINREKTYGWVHKKRKWWKNKNKWTEKKRKLKFYCDVLMCWIKFYWSLQDRFRLTLISALFLLVKFRSNLYFSSNWLCKRSYSAWSLTRKSDRFNEFNWRIIINGNRVVKSQAMQIRKQVNEIWDELITQIDAL